MPRIKQYTTANGYVYYGKSLSIKEWKELKRIVEIYFNKVKRYL
ncbi:MAG: hypothetical protein ABFC18_03285 [Rikenellaceae bacterium]